MNRRRLSPRLRIQFVGLLMILGMAALGLRLWWIQVAHGAEWTAQIRGSSQATVRIPSVRGEIKDHNGLTLVQNRASYEVDFYLPEMVKGYRERFGPPPLAEHRAIISGMPKDVKEPDIIETILRFRIPTSRTSIFRRWPNFPSMTSDFREWTSRSNPCARMFTVRWRLTYSVTSALRTTRTRKRRASSRFIRATRTGNQTSRKRWTNISVASRGFVICVATPKARSMEY